MFGLTCLCYLAQIGGATLHSLLALPVVNNSYGRSIDCPAPTGALLQNLIDFWRKAGVLIIDECSMVSSSMLQEIDSRLQLVRRRFAQAFGGLHVMMLGDMYQLPPPKGWPAFEAQSLWMQFLLVELPGNHRAAEDPAFSELLARLRVGALL